MNDLTSAENKVFDNLSRELNPAIYLGDTIQSIINVLPEAGTPVNAVAAKATLTLTGAVFDGEVFSIGDDVYELDSRVTPHVATGRIRVNIEPHTAHSVGTLTLAVKPTSGDTVTIGTKVYTFVPVGTDTADGEVSIGADLAGAKTALVAAINGTDGISDPHPLVTAADFVANTCVITALAGGAAGNSIPSTTAFTSGSNLFAAATLGGGGSCTASNGVLAIVAAIGASAVDGANDTVVVTAPTAGASANDIAIAATLQNGSFGVDKTTMEGGVDGTVSDGVKVMADETYLYVSIAANTTAGQNWRRIAVGNVY